MKTKVKVQVVLNGREAQINRVLMHRAINVRPGVVETPSKEEREFVNEYEKEIAKAEGAIDVANGDAVATPVEK